MLYVVSCCCFMVWRRATICVEPFIAQTHTRTHTITAKCIIMCDHLLTSSNEMWIVKCVYLHKCPVAKSHWRYYEFFVLSFLVFVSQQKMLSVDCVFLIWFSLSAWLDFWHFLINVIVSCHSTAKKLRATPILNALNVCICKSRRAVLPFILWIQFCFGFDFRIFVLVVSLFAWRFFPCRSYGNLLQTRKNSCEHLSIGLWWRNALDSHRHLHRIRLDILSKTWNSQREKIQYGRSSVFSLSLFVTSLDATSLNNDRYRIFLVWTSLGFSLVFAASQTDQWL